MFCGSGGVEPQSETNWRYANDSEVARIIFVNKLDRMGADFYRVIKQIKDVLNATPVVMTLPIGRENDFVGLVDLLTRKAFVWDDTGDPLAYSVKDVPADMADEVETLFLKAEPQKVGKKARLMVPLRMQRLISSTLMSSPSRYFSITSSSWSATVSISFSRHFSTSSAMSAGTSIALALPSPSCAKLAGSE